MTIHLKLPRPCIAVIVNRLGQLDEMWYHQENGPLYVTMGPIFIGLFEVEGPVHCVASFLGWDPGQYEKGG